MTQKETSDFEKDQYLLSIKDGTNHQFVLDSNADQVYCNCGHPAIWWKTAYICGTITAYPCMFNNPNYNHDLQAVKEYYKKRKLEIS